jgi:membrane-bound lytic murein transglycosylase D
MKQIFQLIVAITLLTLNTKSYSQTSEAQVKPESITSGVQPVDSVKINPSGLNFNDNIDTILSDKLDSMMHTWYVENSFPVDSINAAYAADSLQQALPDSIYIQRLQSLDSYIALPYNDMVRKLINFYFNRRKGMVSVMMGLTNYYFPLFEETLAKYDLPAELKYLPIIESALNPKIVSRAGASGLWQFMYGTGKMYGLEINSYIDERNDPIKSTDAAARYLRDLYAIYGDWHVVIAAYNCGPGNINKAVRRSGGKQSYWEIYAQLPKETRGYIPVFIAANYVMNFAKEHNIVSAKPIFTLLTDTIVVTSYLHFEQISNTLKIPIEEIRQLNPQYKRDIIPAKPDKELVLKLPIDKISPFIDAQNQIFAFDRDKYFPDNQLVPIKDDRGYRYADTGGKRKIYYTVRGGDKPNSIAAKYKVEVSDISEWNHLKHNRIKVGQRLVLFVDSKQSKTAAAKEEQKKKATETKNEVVKETTTASTDGFTYYTVRNGDNLSKIAKQFTGVTDAEIKTINNIKNEKNLVIGQKLKIPIKS